MRLILCRHGNTFGPGDKVVRAGSAEDFPLVEKGLNQAEDVAQFIEKRNWAISGLYCSPLKRTQKTAEIVANKLNLSIAPTIDEKLNELNYGAWGGLTDAEIGESCNQEELDAWNQHSVWPVEAGFQPEEQTVRAEVSEFAQQLTLNHDDNESVLVVSSNGRLRYFLQLIDGELDKRFRSGEFKVKTGHVCVFEYHQESWNLISWNESPVKL